MVLEGGRWTTLRNDLHAYQIYYIIARHKCAPYIAFITVSALKTNWSWLCHQNWLQIQNHPNILTYMEGLLHTVFSLHYRCKARSKLLLTWQRLQIFVRNSKPTLDPNNHQQFCVIRVEGNRRADVSDVANGRTHKEQSCCKNKKKLFIELSQKMHYTLTWHACRRHPVAFAVLKIVKCVSKDSSPTIFRPPPLP